MTQLNMFEESFLAALDAEYKRVIARAHPDPHAPSSAWRIPMPGVYGPVHVDSDPGDEDDFRTHAGGRSRCPSAATSSHSREAVSAAAATLAAARHTRRSKP